jgi:putative membrane-bound dehydrogenase-like protein
MKQWLPTVLLGLTCAASQAAEPRPVFDSGVVSRSTPGHAVKVEADLTGAKKLFLVVRDGSDGFGCDWADWIAPKLVGVEGERKLTDLVWKSATTGHGQVRINTNAEGRPLKVAGTTHDNGIGAHANSVIAYDLPAGFTKFVATAALDDGGTDQGCGSTVQFLVYTQAPPNFAASSPPGQGSRELADAVQQLDVAPGLEATLFAGEPVLFSPSNIDIDHLGRVWVCEVVNYRRFANANNPDRPEGDRILVLEDTNQDGVCDKTTVFYQGKDVDSAHGICVLGDRVIISCGDSVFSLYDRDGDLKADKDSKELLFTGIGGTQHDHGIHAFVFGPDGKLYFNFGNSGGQLKDKDGKPIVDKSGNEINSSRQPYQEGMVFRCNLDGSEVETLGWNFRNNWEVAVDSFGTMWQSDNDDDGNRGVRINYVMEFGNYGYKDEFTGAGWRDTRTNMEEEIPLRHWHLNDPGVVPNLLQTGAGSPTGICVYEGTLLPEIFHGALIHCDAGPNVVRAYVTQPDGAGYKAEIVNILQGARDNWFRPSDVCVAPDGSLIVADWYDPGVGGHRQGDPERGRIFRVAPPGTKYTMPKVDVSTIDGAIAALKSPNQATRYLGWAALSKEKQPALTALQKLYHSQADDRFRARAFWLMSKLTDQARELIGEGLHDQSIDLRATALRAHRELGATELLAHQSEPPSVRRETLIQLHGRNEPAADEIWAKMAAQYDGEDRWYLEALGIAAAGNWDQRLSAYLKSVPDALNTKAGRDIVWRSRATQTPELLVKIISSPDTPMAELPRYFRAFDFLTGEGKDKAIIQLAFATTGLPDDRQNLVIAEAVQRVKGFDVGSQPDKLAALNRVLESSQGTLQYLTLVDRFGLDDRFPEILAAVESAPDSPFAVEAVKLMLTRERRKDLLAAMRGAEIEKAVAATRALSNTLDNRGSGLLEQIAVDGERPLSVRQEAVKGLGKSKPGARRLLSLAQENKLAPELKPAAAYALHSSGVGELKAEIDALFPLPPSRNAQPLPPLPEVVKRQGSVERGKTVYFSEVSKCATCHIVNGQGKEVGPNLSEIGSKLSREAFFESIIYPSAGISHNYETWTAVTTNGTVITGLLVSDTADAVSLKGSDAIVRTIKKDELDELVKQPVSLMPADLQKILTVDELVDVIEFLQTLKKKS